eukprot:2638410-Rhodomonas_salina.3
MSTAPRTRNVKPTPCQYHIKRAGYALNALDTLCQHRAYLHILELLYRSLRVRLQRPSASDHKCSKTRQRFMAIVNFSRANASATCQLLGLKQWGNVNFGGICSTKCRLRLGVWAHLSFFERSLEPQDLRTEHLVSEQATSVPNNS